jgi:hypothetical protein
MPVDQGICEFLWCDLEVGGFGAYIVSQVKLWRKNWRAGEFEFSKATAAGPEPTTVGLTEVSDLPPISDSTRELGEALEATMYAPVDQPDEVAELVDWAKLRLSYVAQNEGATKLLLRLWPAGLPTPKQGITTVDQANEVLSLLSKVEADFELGWPEKPAALQSSGPAVSTRKRRGK